MKAQIIHTPYGSKEKQTSQTIYEVIDRNDTKTILIVGENYDGKPIYQTMENDEVLIVAQEKCFCGNDAETQCPQCGKIQCYECTSKGYYPSDFGYCECGYPIEF